MEYWVGKTKLEYTVDAPVVQGDAVTLLNTADDLTKNTSWSNRGFSIEPLFDDELFFAFQLNTYNLLIKLWRKAGLEVPESFSLSHYHTIAPTWEQHLQAVELTKLLHAREFLVPIQILEERISDILKSKVIVKNPYDDQSVFHFRVIRPDS